MVVKYLVLWPLSILYGLGVSIRNRLFNLGLLESKEFDVPIICIGNITIGGTGKTPHTESIINVLQKDHRVACLSRGYKRKTSGYILATENSTADEIGDEPKQIKNKFPDITVAVDADRVRGVKKLQQLPNPPDIIILDDGFQHRYVKADINILLIDYNRPIYKDHLLPLGRLREHHSALERANYVIITKCPSNITPIEKRIIYKNLKLKAYQELLFTTMKYGDITPLDGKSKYLKNNNSVVLCVTGIAQPGPYQEHLKTLFGQVSFLTFPDHHRFTNNDIQKIIQEFNKMDQPDKYIFTTEKDATRLVSYEFPDEIRERMFYIPIEPEFLTSKDQLIKNIHNYAKQNKRK
ncbi:tetraacyldisaccharide 4'-kinase [Sanguibacteroides justesenii]|uniref:Tetraacyldisaccharide 4'-kinase n=1 Tax=Sanguibacteroides justesenii TaxID=1547597 RepID=A0AB34R630_9PORP|nr:tetraacyldisaccharide 4'-kinase [Sanguibacteroides sp. AM78-02pH3A]KIO46214.1 tetraacyldisaccharide 4'-kinase [Sanguibacteroides justesenii]PXZ44277.1 tetraacyldisaccharide 4'-kinase [Sanguibacteroides justesenii]